MLWLYSAHHSRTGIHFLYHSLPMVEQEKILLICVIQTGKGLLDALPASS